MGTGRQPGLDRYRAKRRFDVSPEPRGAERRTQGDAFVVQKHAARRLHYDLRLELDGVMLSWAVTRGPSLVPGEKRLAMHVEDHPIEYNEFEGTIPPGQYGAGTVMIWDRGHWFPEGDPRKGYAKGHLDFELQGEKLKGRWHLVRMRKREGERGDPWLLIKSDDDAAETSDDGDILDDEPLSVASGRNMEEIAAGKTARRRPAKAATKKAAKKAAKKVPRKSASKKVAAAKKKVAKGTKAKQTAHTVRRAAATSAALRQAPAPRRRRAAEDREFVAPCLAKLTAHAPESDAWVHEIKFDGYRMQARLADGEVTLRTRTGLDWTERFQPIADALTPLAAKDAIIDGEIVVETAEGVSNFSALQEALRSGHSEKFVFYAFDLLQLDGDDLRARPLLERKERLQALLAKLSKNGRNGKVRFSEHFTEAGPLLLEHACRMGLEGIVSKRADTPYRSGRTDDWLKTKCSSRQEFVIAGFVPASNDARAVGALVLGYYGAGALLYAGRTGTGFTRASARTLYRSLSPLTVSKPPFGAMPAEERRARRAIWVEPQLVAEVDVRGWTHAGRVRQAAFKGLREDKDPREVVREEADMPAEKSPGNNRAEAPTVARKGKQAVVDVPLTHPDRVYWEDAGVTKQDLADYYTQVWDWIAPHVTGRVLSLVRCPEGAAKHCFFQKHAFAGLDGTRLTLISEDGDKVIAIDSLDGLMAFVQAGVLEIHVRGSRIDHLDAADRLVFDLDPGPDTGWDAVKEAAREVRARLEKLGLDSYLKTTGGKGLHVVVPIEPTRWDEAKAFARGFATAIAKDDPERYLATAAKKARTGRIFVDYLRNSREATAIAPYSTRARPGATVSVPIAWSELASLSAPNTYSVRNVLERLKRLKSDPWAGIGEQRQKLPQPPKMRER